MESKDTDIQEKHEIFFTHKLADTIETLHNKLQEAKYTLELADTYFVPALTDSENFARVARLQELHGQLAGAVGKLLSLQKSMDEFIMTADEVIRLELEFSKLVGPLYRLFGLDESTFGSVNKQQNEKTPGQTPTQGATTPGSTKLKLI